MYTRAKHGLDLRHKILQEDVALFSFV